MIRKFLIILLALCAVVAAQGKPTIAVYPQPAQKEALDSETMEALCTKILNALEANEYFQGIERTAEIVAAINKELATQVSNNSDDRDIAKISERFKADFLCVVVVRKVLGEYQVDARIVEGKTARREFTGEATGEINKMADLQKMANDVVEKMFHGEVARRKLNEILSRKSGTPGSGSGGQPAATPPEKRSESSTGKPVDGQPAGTSGGKRSEPQVVKDEKFNIDMVLVQGGTFKMGCTAEQSSCGGDEKPVRNVTLGDFYIGKYPVTQKLWFQVMGSNPSKFKKDAKQSYTTLFAEEDNFPVENVSYMMVQEFIEKLNAKTGKRYRLPTEAEWEYAARGGNKSKGYIYSGGNYIDDVAWHNGNSQGKTHAVGGKEPNELGVHDMSGNVWEWANDWKGAYSSSDETNPKGPNKGGLDNYRVFRGGSWNYNSKNCRVSKRENAPPDYKAAHGGFRLARSAQ
jgi:formylglycine-generating enzyme required for sulfatase activity